MKPLPTTFLLFLSTPSARRATSQLQAPALRRPISIHALREEGDSFRRRPRQPLPRFLSTPSARRATHSSGRRGGARRISIHALREEGDPKYHEKQYNRSDFYPRPPRGGRLSLADEIAAAYEFLSTPSARRATL